MARSHLRQNKHSPSSAYRFVLDAFELSKVKVRIVFFTFQTVSEFTRIAGFMGDGEQYPEPANSAAGGLGVVANVDFLSFVPSACAYPLDYYEKLIVKTVGALVIFALLWTRPLSFAIRGKPYAKSMQTAAKASLLWLEIVYTTVSTTVLECFVCQEIGGTFQLRAQMTVSCNSAERRRLYLFYSSCMVLLFPIGTPLLIFVLMYPQRHKINSLMEAAKEEDIENGSSGVISLKRLSHTKQRRASIVNAYKDLKWLVKYFRNFSPNCWWMSVAVLVTRFCQTSALVLCTRQIDQTNIASLITIVAAIVQREAWPYRSNSDNVIAFLCQCLIFAWMFGMQLYLSGLFANSLSAPALIGVLLVLATIALACLTLYLVLRELRVKRIQNVHAAAEADEDAPRRAQMIVHNPDDGVERSMDIEAFQKLYEPTHRPASDLLLARQGYKEFHSTSKVWAHKLTAGEMAMKFPSRSYVSSSGAPVTTVHAGQFVIMPFPHGGTVSLLDEDQFRKAYKASTGTTSSCRTVSQLDAYYEWNATLREAHIYSKSTAVYAKRMTEDGVIETIVGGSVEACRSYVKSDYLVCGSRGGRWPMSTGDFNLRYDTRKPEPASDPRLARAGFKQYKAIGKVVCSRLK